MKALNFFADLHGDQIEQSELEQILLSHFGQAKGVSLKEIHYGYRDAAESALILRYNNDGELVAVEAGAGLKENDLPEIQGKLNASILTPTSIQIGQTVLFAHVPTTGYFRYRDLFQLVPVPKEAPRPDFAFGDHPLMLQFSFQGSVDSQIGMLRRARIGREIELLCVALISVLKGAIGPMARSHWVLADKSDPENWQSSFCQEMYTWPGASGIMVSAFSPIEELTPVARIPAANYYTRYGIDLEQTLDLSENFEKLIDTYFACSRDDRDRFLRASFWFQYAQRVRTYAQSGSFTALVSAVEALIPPATGSSPCPTCKRLTGAGPTQRFAQFVEQYAPGPEVQESHRKKLYALRSALSHGGTLLHSDRFAWSAGMTSNSLRHWEDQTAMWRIIRLVLVNWLLEKRL
jgi:hypothetical protein